MQNNHHIEWDEQWSVGIKTLDDDHKKLVEIINGIIDLYTTSAKERSLRSSMNKLMKYIGSHLKKEEKFLELNGYPQLKKHQEAHLLLMYDVLAVKTKMLSGDYNMLSAEELKRFLIEKWLMEHIKYGDQEYAVYFADKKLVE
jgi:hemerythrin